MVKTGSRWYIIMRLVYSIYRNIARLESSGHTRIATIATPDLRNNANELCVNSHFELRRRRKLRSLYSVYILEGMSV